MLEELEAYNCIWLSELEACRSAELEGWASASLLRENETWQGQLETSERWINLTGHQFGLEKLARCHWVAMITRLGQTYWLHEEGYYWAPMSEKQ
ncbi:hypothetical protein ACFX2F_034616 [Malus domestica]